MLKTLFLNPLLAALLLLQGGVHGTGRAPPCSLPEAEVIVVGAGMSGLSAAATLLARNKKVLVLEGRHEVGGRMRTKTDFGEPAGDIFKGTIELGANWFYGGYGPLDVKDDESSGPVNPMKNFAIDANVAFMEELFNGKTMDFYDLTQNPVWRLPFNEGGDLGDVQGALTNFRPYDRCMSNISFDLFSQLGDFPQNALGSDTVREVLDDQCEWTPQTPIDNVLEVVYYDNELLSKPKDASQLSFTPWGYDDFGDQTLFVYGQNGGLTEVARKYAENTGVLPHVVFNAMVERIDYSDDPAVVTVKIDHSPKCSIEASKVIFTGSQGIVDKFKSSLFKPPIENTSKRQVDLRTWVKIFFQFPVAFWNEGGPRDGPNPVEQFLYIFTAEEDNRKGCNVWMNLDFNSTFTTDPARYTLMPGCRILMGWVPQHIMDEFGGGKKNYVFDYNDFSPGGDVERILKPLKKAFPDSFKPPKHVFATNWQDDECTYGSWNSFKDDESLDNDDYYEYYAPRNDRLWMSGASSCRRHYRNMHGAHFAGVRDGNWVADCLDAGRMTTRPQGICDTYKYPLTDAPSGENVPSVSPLAVPSASPLVPTKKPTPPSPPTKKPTSGASRPPTKKPTPGAVRTPTKEPDKAGGLPTKEPGEAGVEKPTKEPDKGGASPTKEPGAVDGSPTKEPEEAGGLPSKEPGEAGIEEPTKEPGEEAAPRPMPKLPDRCCVPKVYSFTIVKANGHEIGSVHPAETIDLDYKHEVNIRVNVGRCKAMPAKSVHVHLSGHKARCENYSPYTCFGDPSKKNLPDHKANYGRRAKKLYPGDYTISATTYPGKKCCGLGNEHVKSAKIYVK